VRFGVDTPIRLGDLGTTFDDLKFASVSVDPASLAAGAAANTDVALPAGTAPVGSRVFVEAPATLEAGLVLLSASIPAADTLRLRLYNPTAAAIDGAARTWHALIVTFPPS
jgi:hypothetical protein